MKNCISKFIKSYYKQIQYEVELVETVKGVQKM